MQTDAIGDPDAAAPPADLTPPSQALWWLKKGRFATGPEWARAHDICQSREGDQAHDLVHALVHRIEGDHVNADYWYRRAGETRGPGGAEEEWARIAASLHD